MKNPWLDMWLSTANSMAGAACGFWAPELRRLQKALTVAAARPPGPPKPSSRPHEGDEDPILGIRR
jgi:hypothetical protein